MTKFTIDITDKAKLAGITAAREAYNASLPAEVQVQDGVDEKTGEPIMVDVANPAIFGADAEYVHYVMDLAAESYAKQHGTDIAEVDQKISELQAKRAQLAAE